MRQRQHNHAGGAAGSFRYGEVVIQIRTNNNIVRFAWSAEGWRTRLLAFQDSARTTESARTLPTELLWLQACCRPSSESSYNRWTGSGRPRESAI